MLRTSFLPSLLPALALPTKSHLKNATPKGSLFCFKNQVVSTAAIPPVINGQQESGETEGQPSSHPPERGGLQKESISLTYLHWSHPAHTGSNVSQPLPFWSRVLPVLSIAEPWRDSHILI
ncbi:hypothetical protein HJG60_008730 [Phyllostomus discolor]|uniref:Uncharacterized protein n=1 Tax=Phyllostomus discolor TaxID=89673 RepID=A0A834DJ36_9CHIR|nr:hypothetical protein HJG60_008730 [Phyllostomus discolor]